MLDLHKICGQIGELAHHQARRGDELSAKLKLAKERLNSGNEAALREKATHATTSWLVAIPTEEEPSAAFPAPHCPETYTVIATDGSQIAPARDGAASLHLINVGAVTLTYGEKSRALLESVPSLYFEDDDLFVPFGGDEREITGQVLAAKRDQMEYEALRMRITANTERKTIGLVDGTLILWHVEAKPELYKKLGTADLKRIVFNEMFALLNEGRNKKIPIAGYISAPGSTDLVNLLKIDFCPLPVIDCDHCPFQKTERECEGISSLTDATLCASILPAGARTAVFGSSSSILDVYPKEHRVRFFYINTGAEIARVELPAWATEDKELLGQAHALVLDQAKKGRGYPISLAESHEQAVVKGPEREAFLRLVENALIKRGVRVENSRKSILKRRSFV